MTLYIVASTHVIHVMQALGQLIYMALGYKHGIYGTWKTLFCTILKILEGSTNLQTESNAHFCKSVIYTVF